VKWKGYNSAEILLVSFENLTPSVQQDVLNKWPNGCCAYGSSGKDDNIDNDNNVIVAANNYYVGANVAEEENDSAHHLCPNNTEGPKMPVATKTDGIASQSSVNDLVKTTKIHSQCDRLFDGPGSTGP
jgi:hypothetical protein